MDVGDFGIRGMDLAYALQDGYDAVVFVDAAPRGEPPGTLSLIEPELDLDEVVPRHARHGPACACSRWRARWARVPPRMLVVACEPAVVVDGEHDEDLVGELSAPVRAGGRRGGRARGVAVATYVEHRKGGERHDAAGSARAARGRGR